MDNREKSRIIKERIKSIILVVLFLLTILLLYFFWHDIKIEDITLDDFRITLKNDDEEVIAPEDVIIPSHIDISFGNGAYTRIDSGAAGYWKGNEEGDSGMLGVFREVMSSQDDFAEEITEEQYEAVMDAVSVRAVFDYYLPFREYCGLLGIKNPAGQEMIDDISEISFSEGSCESIFIVDRSRKKYYRIVSDHLTEDFLNETESSAQDQNTTYFPLDTYVGEDLESMVLIPSILESSLVETGAFNDLSPDDKEAVRRIAESFFSERLDFVRKIEEESGKTSYIYGYGKKILTIDEKGHVEYRSDMEDTGGVGYFNALMIALMTTADQGGFRAEDGSRFVPYIAGAEKAEDSPEKYIFRFGMTKDGEKIYYKNGDALKVEVTNGCVTYFEREYKRFEKNEEIGTGQEIMPAYSPINVLAENYDNIYEKLENVKGGLRGETDDSTGGSHTTDRKFIYLVSQIDDMSVGYLYRADRQSIVPCYVISFYGGDIRLYFDLYTAEPLV